MNEMNTTNGYKYTLSTNFKCSGCVAKIAPLLDGDGNIIHWVADLQHPHKMLTVTLQTPEPQSVIKALQKAGFAASLVDSRAAME